MILQDSQIHQPSSVSRRKAIWNGFRALPALLLTNILASCDNGNPPPVPQERKYRPLSDVVVELDATIETEAPVAPETKKPEVPLMPNNRFDQPPPRNLPGSSDFLDKVAKITKEERKSHMIAAQGGGRVSDEVRKLEDAWLRPFETLSEIKAAYKSGKLIPLPSIDEGRYFAVGIIGEADSNNKTWYHLIHPDVYNRFNEHVARVFYYKTGKMLKVGGLVRSTAYQASLSKRNWNATKNRSSHEFGRTIDFSIPQVFNPRTGTVETMSSEEREFISKLLTYYEKNVPERTSWLVEGGNCYHGTHFPVPVRK